ncbi:hypothetical protein DPMN_141331 [Dreissena polymorpha]|uniref:Uncharacterized protein n=1 Tax=Dreissena polymorpha TaxID=45954 RepID=A0A9D4G9G9_DREPO|nr:hypothetical protein DPMN_141331 [Dreissena polymorpha]
MGADSGRRQPAFPSKSYFPKPMCQIKSVNAALIAIWPPNNAVLSKPAGPALMGGHCQITLAAGRMDACLESEDVNCN